MKILRIPLVIVLIVGTGRAFNARAQIETNIHSFVGSPTDGNLSYPGLVQGNDGSFYGTAFYGGTHNLGIVFRISPGGTYTNLHSFAGYPTDGNLPDAVPVQGSDGNLYGTTYEGGTSTNCPGGCGAVYRISPSGSYTNLYSFVGFPSDGRQPFAGLVQGPDGNFYGTTYYGGTNDDGTVFRISPSGSETNLYSFVGPPSDGFNPYAGLTPGRDGNFYGTTGYGGPNSCSCGTVFRISPSGSYTTLYSFADSPFDGAVPYAGLVQGADGNFYGATGAGGVYGMGTVFQISPSGNKINMYSFGGVPNDGNEPEAETLVQGSDGNFYGTTFEGGTSTNCFGGCGTLFRISPGGNYTNLYSFFGHYIDGHYLQAGLVQGRDGSFYGTTGAGGTNDAGTVFKVTVPLSPAPYPINQITNVHVAATNVIFNVVSIAGEIYQLQFSSSMKPTNWVNVASVSVTNSIGALLTLTNFGGATQPQGFYRFDITP